MKKLLFVVMIALFSAKLVLDFGQPASAGNQRAEIANEKVNHVNYRAFFDKEQQRVYGEMGYNYTDKAGVEEYISFNKTAAREIAQRRGGRIYTNVIFSHPLSEEEFLSFTVDYADEVIIYKMRGVEPDGKRVTLLGAPENGQVVPHEFLDIMVGDMSDRNGGVFLGWIEAKIVTDPQRLQRLLDDPHVFTIEAGHTFIHDRLKADQLRQLGASDKAIENIMKGRDMDVQITGPSLYWSLEDHGFVKMPAHPNK